ncbi:MAG: ATP-binding protein [Cecembia sp.]
MVGQKKKYKVANKVVLGFLLAFILVVVVSAVTYVSIRNLLETVENLSEPNEKLRQLNGLLADVYLLDMSKTERTSDRDSVFEATEKRLKERLDWLKLHAEDSLERSSFEKISMDLSELMVVYAGLEEVRYNLTSRTFSEEALKNIERRIQRQQELSEMQFLGRIRNRDLLAEITLPEKKETAEEGREEISAFEEELMAIVREIREIEIAAQSNQQKEETTDAALEALKTFMTQVYQDEQKLQQNFLYLENRLINKNKDIFSQIQQLLSSMQREILVEYRAKNDSAYELTYTVSLVLGIMIFLGIIGSLGFVNSILTEIRKGNEYRLKLEEAKKKSDDLAKAKQDFLANMSHEIRNPLHAIQGYQQALKRKSLSPQQTEDVNMIGFASETLVGIVNDILDFSKLEAGKIKIEKHPFNPQSLFTNLQRVYKIKAEEKGLSFDWEIQLPKEKWVLSDQLRISQILSNLVSNAIKFTQEGAVQVKVRLDQGTHLQMSVRDTGMGMSDSFKENIFQEFNQGDTSITRQYGGTGLGLAITKKLIDLLEGEISIKSSIGKGTEIMVELPVELTAAQVEAVTLKDGQAVDLTGLRLLLVDDDSLGLKLLKTLLIGKGAEVIAYEGGAIFKEEFDFKSPIDLAILDIQMPKVSGVEVLKMLKEKPAYHALPIMAMTANVFVEEQEKLLANGFTALLLKPFSEAQVLEKIVELLPTSKIKSKQRGRDMKSANVFEKHPYELTDIEKFCMGDKEMLQEVMLDIIDHTQNDLKKLHQALLQNELATIRAITHQLSSRLKQIKVEAGDQAKNIEVAIKSGDLEGLSDKIPALIAEIEKVLSILRRDFSGKISTS